jgi:hypothetical protein
MIPRRRADDGAHGANNEIALEAERLAHRHHDEPRHEDKRQRQLPDGAS